MGRERGEEVAASADRTIRVRLYEDGQIRLTIVRGTRYAIRQMWFDSNGGNILLLPVEGTGEPFPGSDTPAAQ
jgi:hypothetical protein